MVGAGQVDGGGWGRSGGGGAGPMVGAGRAHGSGVGRVGRSPALCLKAQVLSSLLEAGGREAQEWDCITQSPVGPRVILGLPLGYSHFENFCPP